ncbi:MAG: class I SAM-dependent methyltransferase [Nitrospira sp.]|nr:class I SAM-dependent methyltransferase [Nitrospira sp.]
MGGWQKEYIDKYYRQLPDWKDLGVRWRELLQENVPHNARVLEVGPGPSTGASKYLSTLSGHLVGLDIDPEVKQNKSLDEVHVYDGQRFPFPNNHFDAVVSSWVHEHVENPETHCKEIYRVLVPNGKYIFRIPNLYHYTSIGARFTPHWFHTFVANRLRNFPSDHHAPYPTYYRLNTRRRVRSLLSRIGFVIEVLEVEETYPVYGLASRIMFYMFMAYERIVNSTPLLEDFRYLIDGVVRKNARSR